MKGICFIEPLFYKVPEGLKTQTRRLVKIKDFDIDLERALCTGIERYGNNYFAMFKRNKESGMSIGTRSRYKPGEVIFLKEPYFCWEPEHAESFDKRIVYKYGCSKKIEKIRKMEFEAGYEYYFWHNKLFMKAHYARYFIEITDLRAERAKEISQEDAVAEGCKDRDDFFKHWIKINGKKSLDNNPWVFVYEFRLTQKPKI